MKLYKTLAITVLSLTTLIGCSNQTTPTQVDESIELQTISVAEVAHSIFYAPQYVAMEMGYFAEQGIEIDLWAAQGADKTMASLLSGEVQIGLMGPEASIYIYNQGSKDYAVNFAQLTKRDGSFLVGREQNNDFEISDLAGAEIIGGRKGGVPFMTLEYVVKSSGLVVGENTAAGEANVRSDVQYDVMSGAFIGGEGDYVTLFEPLATQLELAGEGYIVASIGKESGEIPYTAYNALDSYIAENEDLIQRFTNAISSTNKQAN